MAINWGMFQQPHPQSGANQGMSVLSDALDAVMARRQQKALKDQEIEAEMERARLQREQSAEIAQNQMAQSQMQHQATMEAKKREFEQKRAENQTKALNESVMPALRAGRAGEAAAMGAPMGIRVQQRALPNVPNAPAPVADPADAFSQFKGAEAVGGAPSMLMGVLGRGQLSPEQLQYLEQRAPQVQQDFDARQAALPEQQAEFDRATEERKLAMAQRQAAEAAGPQFDIEMDGAPSLVYRGNELREANQANADMIGQAFAGVAKEDYEKRALAETKAAMASAIASGKPMSEDAAADFYQKAVENERNRMNSTRNAQIAASRPRDNTGPQNTSLDNARADLQMMLQQAQYKGVLGEMRSFAKMEALASADNPLADRALLGSFVKMAQGGAGVLTQSDIETFWNTAGSIGVRTEDQLAQALMGTMGADKKAIARAAVKKLAQTARRNYDDLYERAAGRMRRWGEDGDAHLRWAFGRGLPEFDDQRRKEAAARAAAVTGDSGKRADALMEKYKAQKAQGMKP